MKAKGPTLRSSFLFIIGTLLTLFIGYTLLKKFEKPRLNISVLNEQREYHVVRPVGVNSGANKLSRVPLFVCSSNNVPRPPVVKPSPLRFPNQFLPYFKYQTGGAVDGWTAPGALMLTWLLSKHQHEIGISGTVGEIGVHHGRFFIGIALTAREGESIFALDVFEDKQDLNVDRSGSGSLHYTRTHAEKFGINMDKDVIVVKGASNDFSEQDFISKGLDKVRYMSIDGGHTTTTTQHDLNIAACVTNDGSIVVVDDFQHVNWPGVSEGVFRFIALQPLGRNGQEHRLVPFLQAHNKLYLTTPSHHKIYVEFLKNHPFYEQHFKTYPDAKRENRYGTGLDGFGWVFIAHDPDVDTYNQEIQKL
ncbi:ycf45 [Acrasis kona]|uniref:Ycf45 n=1 Tax=Acrasis kona TaxID=1008807 RepID=A0AAW2YQK5_9EUKA